MGSNEDTLISRLIEETCNDSLEKDQLNTFGDLRNYFEKRLNEVDFLSINDYLLQHHLSCFEINYQKNSQCYRMTLNQSILDFPSNWSIFKDLKTANLIYLDHTSDQDFLLDLFSELNGSFSNIALVRENEYLRLIFLPEENAIIHLKWLRSYFENKNAVLIENKAA